MFTYKWIKTRWNRCWRGNNASEMDTFVSKLCSKETVHWIIERRNFSISEKHLDRFIIFSSDILKICSTSLNDINYNIFILKTILFAFVDSSKNINIPYCWSIKEVWTENLGWWEVTSIRHWSKKSRLEVISHCDILFIEVNIIAILNVYYTKIKSSFQWEFNIVILFT